MTTTAAVQEDPRLPVGLLLRDLRAAPDGLSQREAARRLAAYGPNELQPGSAGTGSVSCSASWCTPLALLLWLAAGCRGSGTLVLGPLLLVTNGGTSDSALDGVDAVGWR